MNPYSRAFSRSVGMLMLNADKAVGGGGKQKTDLELLEESREQVKTLEGDLKTANQAKADADAAKLTAETDKATAEQARKDAEAAQQKAEADLKTATEQKEKLEGDLKTANAAKDKAEADLKTSDERAETKLREISTRNGGVLPPKDATAGDFSSKQDVAASEPPAKRLASFFKVAGE